MKTILTATLTAVLALGASAAQADTIGDMSLFGPAEAGNSTSAGAGVDRNSNRRTSEIGDLSLFGSVQAGNGQHSVWVAGNNPGAALGYVGNPRPRGRIPGDPASGSDHTHR